MFYCRQCKIKYARVNNVKKQHSQRQHKNPREEVCNSWNFMKIGIEANVSLRRRFAFILCFIHCAQPSVLGFDARNILHFGALFSFGLTTETELEWVTASPNLRHTLWFWTLNMVAEPPTFPVNIFFLVDFYQFIRFIVYEESSSRRTSEDNQSQYSKLFQSRCKSNEIGRFVGAAHGNHYTINSVALDTAHLVDLKFMTAFVIQTNNFVCICVIEWICYRWTRRRKKTYRDVAIVSRNEMLQLANTPVQVPLCEHTIYNSNCDWHTHTAESENWCEHVTRLSWMLRILSIEFFSRLSFIDRRQQKKTKRKSSLEIKWHKASEWISMWMVCYYIKLLSNNKTFDHVKPYNSKFNVFIFVVFFADGTISQPFHHRSIVIFTFENISLYYIYTMKLLLFIVSWYVPKPFVLFTGFFVLLLYL